MGSEYKILDLLIEKTSEDTFLTKLLDDKQKVLAQNEFTFDTDSLTVIEKLHKFEDGIVKPSKDNEALIRNFGEELYKKVFSGEVLKCYKQSLDETKNLRIRLRLKDPELMILPWEFLYDGSDFLSTSLKTTLLRLPGDIPPPKLEKIAGKLKMLIIISSPLDLEENERLQIEFELEKILQTLDKPVAAGKIEIDYEDEASLENIQNRLDEEEYHIVHYTGHGAFSEREGKGFLILEDEKGNKTSVDNETIAKLFCDYPSIRLIFLSGCQTAKATSWKAFSDLSRPLLKGGISSVVSMQYSIRDNSAISLAEKFYTCLGKGNPLDLALSKARKELYLASDPKIEFATPILFSNNPDCLKIEKVEKEDISFRVKPPDQKIYIDLEQLGTKFIGRRRELRRIERDFTKRGIRAVIIHGIGGIGKTVTATKVARRLYDKPYYGVYTFDCRGGNLKAGQILVSLNEYFKANESEIFNEICSSPMPLEQKVNFLGQILGQMRLLLIFDNFEDMLDEETKREIIDEDLKKTLKTLVNLSTDGTRFLFTTRYNFNLMNGRMTQLVDAINLGELSRPEAIMIMNRFPDIAKEDFSTKLEIYNKIGGHPYTINIFGSHCRSTSAQDVLLNLGDVNKEMAEFALLDMTYGKLSKDAKELLNRISAYQKPIPLEGLQWMMGDGEKFPNIERLLEEIIHWSLLVKLDVKGGVSYQVHTIVRDFVYDKLGKDSMKQWLIKGGEFYEDLSTKTRSLWTYLEARNLYFEAEEYDKAGEMVSNVTKYLYRWGFMDLAKDLNQETIETASGLTKARALNNLGMILSSQGNYKRALEKYEQSIKIKEELGDKHGIATSLGQIGNIHYLRGNYKKAVENHRYVLKIFEELGDKSNIATALHQIGMIHQDQGNYKVAMEKYEQSLKIREELGDKSGIAITLHQIGIIHQHQGNYKEAIEKYEQSLKIAEELGDKSGIATTLHQIGMIHHDQGNYKEAMEKYEQSLKIKEELGDKSGIATTLHQIGMIHQHQGNYKEAMEKYEQSLKITEELGDKSGIAITLGQIGILSQEQGNIKEAIRYYIIAYNIFEDLNSPYRDIVGGLLAKIAEEIGEKKFNEYLAKISKETSDGW